MKKQKPYRISAPASIVPITNRVLVGVPMTGLLRAEWVLARYSQIIPVNWGYGELIQYLDTYAPLSYAVDDARNIVVKHAVERDYDWILFIDHDVVLPADTFVKMNDYIRSAKYPVVCGWYNAKGNPPEPLLFRGRGNSYYDKWKPGDKVWVDGVPMGCTLINMKLVKPMWESSEPYKVGNIDVRRLFYTPRGSWKDPETKALHSFGGTEDLYWCDRVINEGWLRKLKFKEVQDKKYPFLVDTSIQCGHITNDGKVY